MVPFEKNTQKREVFALKTPEKIKWFIEEYENLFHHRNAVVIDKELKQFVLDSIYLHFNLEYNPDYDYNLVILNYNLLREHMMETLNVYGEKKEEHFLNLLIRQLEEGIWDFLIEVERYKMTYLFDKEHFHLSLFIFSKDQMALSVYDPEEIRNY